MPFFRVGTILRITVTKLIHDPRGLGVLECCLRELGQGEALAMANLTLFAVPDLAAFLNEKRD